MWLIQGFFVQQQNGLDIAHVGGEGATVVVRREVFPLMYAGAIYKNPVGKLEGATLEAQGEANLFDIVIVERSLRFTKQYVRHKLLGARSHIFYRFDTREENTWLGTWQYADGSNSDRGLSRCILTEVNDALFQEDLARYAQEKGLRRASHT